MSQKYVEIWEVSKSSREVLIFRIAWQLKIYAWIFLVILGCYGILNTVFGFGGKSKSDATIPDVVGCRSPSFALIGYGICLESEKIYTFVGEYSKGACLNIHHSLFPAVKRGNLNGKQAGRLNFVHRLCGVRSDCFRVFHDLTAADCSPYIFKIFCYLCHCNKGTPTYSRPVQ